MKMRPLQVLIIEDSENDATLLELELERAGYTPACRRVETREAMLEALQNAHWDIIIADYIMPHFNGLAALALVKELGLDLPFIVVSGHITDDTAVAAMKAGAHDYVMKDNLARLGVAVDRELRDAEVRRERRQTQERLEKEQTLRLAIEMSVPSGITAVDLEGRQTYVNPAFCQMVGWSESELLGQRPPFTYWPPEERETIAQALSAALSDGSGRILELRFRRRSHERIHVLLQITPLKDAFGNITGWVSSVSNISDRKQAQIRLAAEHAITRILANAQSLQEAAPGIMQVLLDALELDLATLWLLYPKHQTLHPLHVATRHISHALRPFLETTRRLAFSQGHGVPGRVWATHQPVWIPDIAGETDFERIDASRKANLHSLIAFPIQNAGDFLGVLEFLSSAPQSVDDSVTNMMSAIGSEIGQFIQRRSAEDALRRAHDELELRVQQRTAELHSTNKQLQASIADRKRLEHELLEITEQERRRIGLDLHDDLGQKLSGVALMTKGLQLKLEKLQADEARDAARIHDLVQEAMNHASDLAHDLATLDFPENSLPAALKHLSDHAREMFGIVCPFKTEGEVPALESNAVHQLYKIAQEALTNAIKHAKARRVSIQLSRDQDRITLVVQNNGLPFPDIQGRSPGMGLRIMNYRASLLGGSLSVRSNGNKGAILTCSVPLGIK